jgi:uncharacterized protein
MRQIKKTKHYSLTLGGLCEGCKQCVKGKKLVLYVTGLCNSGCFYCPLSNNRAGVDKVWANERLVSSFSDVVDEATLCKATGAGITGGDPLLRLSRTVSYIRFLKSEFGKKFHIHIYLPLTNVTSSKLERLYNAGVDEIRFHPKDKDWDRIELATKFKWKIGIEIPVLPDGNKIVKEMISHVSDWIDFVNLNELEYSDTNSQNLKWSVKDSMSYGIAGSERDARKLLLWMQKFKFNVHYCSSKLKDKVQMSNRIKLRAKSVSFGFDTITSEGTLIRGAVYPEGLQPGFDYNSRLAKADKKKVLKMLEAVKDELKLEFGFNGVVVDSDRLRLLTSVEKLKKAKDSLKEVDFRPAIVEEYPTWDKMIVELEWL